jgi:hypothetical protein
MNTETGSILKELRKSKKRTNDDVKLACLYALNNKLSLKEVGVYEFPNGHLIFDRYPSTKAETLLNEILEGE